MALAGLRLEAPTLEDYNLSYEMFSGLLLLVETNKLLDEKCSIMQKKAIDYFIQVS